MLDLKQCLCANFDCFMSLEPLRPPTNEDAAKEEQQKWDLFIRRREEKPTPPPPAAFAVVLLGTGRIHRFLACEEYTNK